MGLFDGVMNLITGGKDGEASDYMRQSGALFDGLRPPSVEEQEVFLEQLRSSGQLTPELEQALSQQMSEMQGVSVDPRLKDAQLKSLMQLQEIADQGGMTFEDRSRLAELQSATNQQEKGNREAILQNMAQRGMGGSGFELAAQLANQQGAAERAASGGLDIKAQAEKRALEALMQSGNMAGSMRGQEFGEKSAVAQAQDEINRFNTANRQSTQARNTDRMNQAQASNLQNQQRVADANVELRNQQQQYNKELKQGQFQNQMQIASGRSGALQNQAQLAQQQGQGRRQFLGDLITGGATAYAASDERLKEDVKPAELDVDAFLRSLEPVRFKYKDAKRFGEGEHVGVMAQDLEKSRAGSTLVKDTPEGKVVDVQKAAMAALAGLARIDERLKKVEG